jgi:hypothetical protein
LATNWRAWAQACSTGPTDQKPSFGAGARQCADRPSFIEAGEPSDDGLHALPPTLIGRLVKMLTRQGALIEEMGQTDLVEPDVPEKP